MQTKNPQNPVSTALTRRDVLKTSSLVALGAIAPSSYAWAAADDRLRIGVAGVGNHGGANINGVSSEHIVALCDTDPTALSAASQRFPDAFTCSDWRDLIVRDDLDAVVISTADHHHAQLSIAAMRRGLHVYCEKPLAHVPAEARLMQQVYAARKDRVATQMGTQIHAGENFRRVVELIHAGAIGPVRESHVWCERTIVPPDKRLPKQPIPEGFDWDAWLGPAEERPYNSEYWSGGNLNWNRRWDFGNGVLGDMGSHLVDLSYWALDLQHPTSVEAEGPDPDPHLAPPWMQVTWEHPARPGNANLNVPCKVVWYDGAEGMRRRNELLQPMVGDDTQLDTWGIGIAFIGDRGVLTADYGRLVLSPSAAFEDYQHPEPTIPRSPGHHLEWINACKGQGTALCNFDYSGKLIEHNLLGIAAYRHGGGKLTWDAKAFSFGNAQADQYLTKTYREGWSMKPEA